MLSNVVLNVSLEPTLSVKKGGVHMIDAESPHKRLQEQIDCQLDLKPREALQRWQQSGWTEEPGTDSDEAPLKLLALYILEAIGERAVRMTIDKDQGAVVYGDTTYNLPAGPPHFIARGLELLREMTGMEGATAKGTLALGVRNDTLELIIQKQGGLHIINIPGIAEVRHA